jgi:predicted O-methyltransferase YrrM
MPDDRDTVRILVIRAWSEPVTPLRAALRAAGVLARITRVDAEASLDVALARGPFDYVLVDPASRVAPEVIEARMRVHERSAPVLSFSAVDKIVHELSEARRTRTN